MGDNKTENKKQNSVELEASLAPAEAEVGAVAKADQKMTKVLYGGQQFQWLDMRAVISSGPGYFTFR